MSITPILDAEKEPSQRRQPIVSATAVHVASKDAKVHIPERQSKPDNAESIEDALALCQWEDDGGVVPQPNVES
jgi:hypothetical protein